MKKRLLIIDDDPAVGTLLQTQLGGSQWLEVCGQTASVEDTWRALDEEKMDMVLLGGVREVERGVLCQQLRLSFPHLHFIAACTSTELMWEPFWRNLGMWVIGKPIQPGQLEVLAMQLSSLSTPPSLPPINKSGMGASGISGQVSSVSEPYTQSHGFVAPVAPAAPGQAPVLPGQSLAGGTVSSGGTGMPLTFPAVAEARPEPPYKADSNGVQRASKRLMTVYGPKGGVGKTFLSRELAIYFAQRKNGDTPLKVLAVDFNLDLGTFATALNLSRTPNLYTWVQDIDRRLRDWIRSHGREPDELNQQEWQEYIEAVQLSPQEVDNHIVVHEASGLHVLTSPRDIRNSFEIKDYHLYLILDALKHSGYDVILIDTAPDTTDATIQALFFAEQVIMVGNPVVDSIENIQRILKLLREAEYPEERIQLCMNRLQRKEMFTLDEIRAYFQLHPSKKIFAIPDDQEVKKSINTGNPVMLHPGKLAAKDAIIELGKALLPEQEGNGDSLKRKEKGRSSLWKWLKR
ncbi:AAA family ATPase [Brevibacillus ruminantium]|uniref:AAA family ATPase n=1 Tax=Brevibacillus ruminantium TaxID=2950604 RepID=A0ABY4WGN3_9BACL|nr:AAA family ATPase [Brevibacillus ruminantium]USG65971.1 AAA family ATPase [Brevibacillus ruminantium]